MKVLWDILQHAYPALLDNVTAERLGPPFDRPSVGIAIEVLDLLRSTDSSTISNCQEYPTSTQTSHHRRIETTIYFALKPPPI